MESSNELFNIKNTPRPLRDVSVNYSIDNEKCIECDLKPCLDSCPIDSIHLENDVVRLDENCIGFQMHVLMMLSILKGSCQSLFVKMFQT